MSTAPPPHVPSKEQLKAARTELAPYRSLPIGQSDEGWVRFTKLVDDLSDPVRVAARALVLCETEFGDLKSYARTAYDAVAMTSDLAVTRMYLERAKDLSKHPASPHAMGLSRRCGAALGYAQRGDALERLLPLYMRDEALVDVLACWLHEHIARGRPAPSSAADFRALLIARGHPLAVLPLELHESERGVLNDPEGTSLFPIGNWLAYRGRQAAVRYDERPSSPASKRLPTATYREFKRGERQRFTCGVADDQSFPNGTWEVACFELAEPIRRLCDYRIDALPKLGSLRQGKDPLRYTLVETDPSSLPERLWWLGTTGGAYGQASAAYGRLHAWRAMEAWSGLDPSSALGAATPDLARLQRILDALGSCEVARYRPAENWQCGVHEAGFMCLRAGGEQLVVFAFSDTD